MVGEVQAVCMLAGKRSLPRPVLYPRWGQFGSRSHRMLEMEWGRGGRGENKYDDVLMRVPVDKHSCGASCGQTGENTPSPRGPVPTS